MSVYILGDVDLFREWGVGSREKNWKHFTLVNIPGDYKDTVILLAN
jgi:hypothetical protein